MITEETNMNHPFMLLSITQQPQNPREILTNKLYAIIRFCAKRDILTIRLYALGIFCVSSYFGML